MSARAGLRTATAQALLRETPGFAPWFAFQHGDVRPLLESVGATREVMALATCLYTIRWEGRMGTEEVRAVKGDGRGTKRVQ